MNKVNLNEYIEEGLGEIHSLIAYEVQVFFKKYPQNVSFLRKSNTSFDIDFKLKNVSLDVSYEYLIEKDQWRLEINNKTSFISEGRSKNVAKITHEMVKQIMKSLS